MLFLLIACITLIVDMFIRKYYHIRNINSVIDIANNTIADHEDRLKDTINDSVKAVAENFSAMTRALVSTLGVFSNYVFQDEDLAGEYKTVGNLRVLRAGIVSKKDMYDSGSIIDRMVEMKKLYGDSINISTTDSSLRDYYMTTITVPEIGGSVLYDNKDLFNSSQLGDLVFVTMGQSGNVETIAFRDSDNSLK